MNTCLIAVARNEERFIDEWINYHLNLGFNHIYICDNNDIDNPLVINNPNVTIYDYRGISFKDNGHGLWNSIQITIYNETLSKVDTMYDYCGICDIDEFFDFKGLTLNEFIQKHIIDLGYTCAEIPWLIYTDNGLIKTMNIPTQEMYTEVCDRFPFIWCENEGSWGKPIFKLNKGIKYYIHWPVPESMTEFKSNHITHDIAYVKHYRTRCIEDYLEHKFKYQDIECTPMCSKGVLKFFFDVNDITFDKILFALNWFKNNNINISDKDKEFLLKSLEKLKPISVVIRTHNRINELKKCIQSVYNQTCVPNIVILDDNSSDGTFEYASTLKDINYVRFNTNLGPGGIVKQGKYFINTPYYIFLDDDDIWINENFIKTLYTMIIDYPDYDIYGNGFYHCLNVVRTDKLLKCPNLSAWAKDDWYYDWIKLNSNHCPFEIPIVFYQYNYYDNEDKAHTIDESRISFVTHNFYNCQCYDEVLQYINENYHKCNLKERKVFDEVKEYLNDK